MATTNTDATLPTIQYTSRDFDSMVSMLQEYVRTNYPDIWTDFFESNIGQSFMDMVAIMGDNNSFIANQISREMFLATCQRRASALKVAKSTGYRTRGVTASSLTLYAVAPYPLALQNQTLRFAEGTTIKVGDLTFQLPYDVEFAPGTTINDPVTDFVCATGDGELLSFSFSLSIPSKGAIDPGSVTLSFIIGGATVTVTDTGHGAWGTASNGMSVDGSIDYASGAVTLTLENPIDEDTTITASYTHSVAITVSNSEAMYDEFISDGKSLQTFRTLNDGTNVLVDNDWDIAKSDRIVKVYVNGDLWTEVESMKAVKIMKCYETFQLADGRLEVKFGDNVFGAVPATGATIRVEYRVGGGIGGNVASGAADSTRVDGYFGSTTATLSFTNYVAASGGSDAETLAELKVNIPAWTRTVDKAITNADYNTLAATYEDATYGAIARAIAVLRESGPNANIVDVFVWSFGNAAQSLITDETSQGLKESLYRFLHARRLTCVQVYIQDGTNVYLDMDLGTITIDERLNADEVNAAIEEALTDFFLDTSLTPGQSFRLSDFYKTIESVDGVLHFQIESMTQRIEKSGTTSTINPPADCHVGDTELLVRGNITYVCAPPPDDATVTGCCP